MLSPSMAIRDEANSDRPMTIGRIDNRRRHSATRQMSSRNKAHRNTAWTQQKPGPNHPGQIFITQKHDSRLDRHDRDGVRLRE